tara:strand:- start:456 stop:638 length:183 start_codon:yes stop_codon:yes gene_type:complete
MCYYNQYLYTFGGFSRGMYSDAFHRYSLKESKWEEVVKKNSFQKGILAYGGEKGYVLYKV